MAPFQANELWIMAGILLLNFLQPSLHMLSLTERENRERKISLYFLLDAYLEHT